MTQGGCDRGTKPGASMNHICNITSTRFLHVARRHGCAAPYSCHPPEHHLPNVQSMRFAAFDTD